ncbi:siderophore-interacting protein [Zobellia galactanivorans]|uniref:Siderophore-interacting protein n=1 Tax=Zobellia galactanivorans (strain DSM 12802 / CCUG 47099 / CIP 106680 / NCIMB 13871 / Dsij) TaxID=63186 RepID=G0L7X1_ZOBGA|nr:siderophore-interacting protein [Zobellia galactanivorans]MDO6808747.1 siderophore-interacting protein [Zobellia galactanivorans]CAZ98353.1 Siderophore-interacting protein [Zobellia galactanivorans]
MGIVETLIKKILEKGRIVEKLKLSESVYKIRITSKHIKDVDFTPGYFIRLGVGIGQEEIALKDKVRSYSVWAIDRENETIDLAIATHSRGIGAVWAETCQTDTEVHFKWKKGNFLLDDSADSYLMIGDLSALSHLYVIKRHLPEEKQVESIIYNHDLSEMFPDIDGSTPFRFFEMPENPAEEVLTELRPLLKKMQGRKMVYIAGDSRLCVALNKYFRKELNWDTKQIKTKPFWNPDKKGLE